MLFWRRDPCPWWETRVWSIPSLSKRASSYVEITRRDCSVPRKNIHVCSSSIRSCATWMNGVCDCFSFNCGLESFDRFNLWIFGCVVYLSFISGSSSQRAYVELCRLTYTPCRIETRWAWRGVSFSSSSSSDTTRRIRRFAKIKHNLHDVHDSNLTCLVVDTHAMKLTWTDLIKFFIFFVKIYCKILNNYFITKYFFKSISCKYDEKHNYIFFLHLFIWMTNISLNHSKLTQHDIYCDLCMLFFLC